METRKTTKAGVLFWTPAPVCTSPTSSAISEDAWEDEDEEQAGDFVSQMDENGIIGLAEALEDVELGETYDDAECNPNLYAGPLTPEEADPSGHERDTPPEELSYSLSEHLSHTESPGDDAQILSPCDDLMGSLKAWTVDGEVRQRKGEKGTDWLPERDRYFDMMVEEKDGEEAGKRSGRKRRNNEHNKGEIEKIGSTRLCSAHLLAMEPAGVSNHHCPISQPASAVTGPTFPHLLHFTAEEMAAPGIEAETFPEMSFIDSLSESHRSRTSLKSSPRWPELKLRASLQPAAMFSEEVESNHHSRVNNGPLKGSVESNKHHKRPTASPRKTRQHSPEASRTRSFSMVRADPLKFKHHTTSPGREPRTPRARSNAAEVVESRKGPLSYRTPDFSMVEPRVRFPKGGYKPPKSTHSFKRESLSPEPPLVFKSPADIVKEILLNTTEGSPASSESDRPPTSALNSTVPQEFRCRQQATTLLEQLQEDYSRLLTKYAEAENTIDRLRLEAKVNLYSDPPKPSHSAQSGLNHDASKVMTLDFPKAQTAEIHSASLHPNGHSTPQRSSPACPSTRSPDLGVGQQLAKILYSRADKFLQQLQTFEDLLKSEKLKPFEQMKGLSQLAEGLDSLERGYLLARDEHKLLQQRGAEVGPFDPERELEGLIFQCGLRTDELKEQAEQMRQEQPTCEGPPSPPRHPTPSSLPSEGGETLICPQSPPVPLLVDVGEAALVEVSSASDEEDEETLNGKHRCVKQDFDTLVDHYESFKELPKLLDHSQREGAPLRTDMQKERLGRGAGNMEVQKSLLQRNANHTSQQQMGRCSPPLHRASSHSPTLPVHAPSSRRLKVGKSHSSMLSEDGIISPEMDSGFVGSEGSRLTPAASSPVHERASESVLVPQEGPAPSPASLLSHSDTAMELKGGSWLGPDQLRMRTFSPRQMEQTRADNGQKDQYMECSSSLHSSSPAGHGNFLTAWSSHDTIQALQTEVTRLKDKLESCVKKKTPLSSAREPPSAQENDLPWPRVRPGLSDVRWGGRDRQTVDDVEESALRRTTRKRPAAHTRKPQPDISMERPPLVSRCTQTSTAVRGRTRPRQHPGVSETADEPDGRSHRAPLCPLCLLRHQGRPKRPVGGDREPTHSSRCHLRCPLCGHPEPDAETLDRAAAAPPALLRCMPMCQPPLLLYSSPLYVSPSNSTGTSSGARGRGEVRRTRRSLSADEQRSVDRSLTRAIRAALHMKRTSRQMARSLATGLHYQEQLTQSCSY